VHEPVGSIEHQKCCVNFANQSVSFPEFVSALRVGTYIDPHFQLQSAHCEGWDQHGMVVRWSRSHGMTTADTASIDTQIRAAAAAASVHAPEAYESWPRKTDQPPPVLTSLQEGAGAVCDRLGIPRSTCDVFFPVKSVAEHATKAGAMLAQMYCPGSDGASAGRTFPILQQALYLYLRDYDALRFPYPQWMLQCCGAADTSPSAAAHR
jgi:hypothetical protein